jgi:signal transduction histidine kinase
MVGMRARARNAGGELHIDTRPGNGVSVEALVPYRAPTGEKVEA